MAYAGLITKWNIKKQRAALFKRQKTRLQVNKRKRVKNSLSLITDKFFNSVSSDGIYSKIKILTLSIAANITEPINNAFFKYANNYLVKQKFFKCVNVYLFSENRLIIRLYRKIC